MIEKLILITLLIFCLMMCVALAFSLAVHIYAWRHKDDVKTKEEWKIM